MRAGRIAAAATVSHCCVAIVILMVASAAKPVVTLHSDDVIDSPLPKAALAQWTDAPGRRAVALAVPGATLRGYFAPDANVRTIVGEGDPVEAILRLTDGDRPDIALVGVKGGHEREATRVIIDKLLVRVSYPLVVAHGARQSPA